VLGADDVGHRVVVRRVAGTAGDRPQFTDLLGELLGVSETEVTVRTRRGAERVPRNEIVLAKRVPDRRRPSATEALELAAAAGWPAADRAFLGDWWLRATEGWTSRGNSVLPVGDPGRPLDEAITAVERWYRERGLPPKISVPLPLRARLDAELDRRGWRAYPATLVMVSPLAGLAGEHPDVRIDRSPPPEWLAVAAARKKRLPPAAVAVLTGPPEVAFAGVYRDGEALAIGRGVVADEERRWLGVALVETASRVRRRGLATQVMGALAAWGRSVGARDSYLQVEEVNTAAVELYRRLGFAVHHSYVIREAPSAG
jgi:GNAT superfamily N-acetyltransferase